MSQMALAWHQFRFERKLFWRNPSAAFFNFLLPLLLLFLTATAFSADSKELEILIPGIAGMSVVATTFTSLAFNLTILREDGVLKRWRGTPMPAGAYLGGLLGSAALNAFIQVLIVVTIGNVIYGVEWPEDPLLLRLLLVRRPAGGLEGRGGGAAAEAPDRRAVGRDHGRRKRYGNLGAGGRRLGRGRAGAGGALLPLGVGALS